MSMQTTRYTRPAIWLHWIIAILMIFMLFQQMFGDNLIRVPVGESPAAWGPSTHASIGLTILLLGLARLCWRIGHPPPALPNTMSRWQVLASQAVHFTFYGLMVALPVTGMLALVPYGAERLNVQDVAFFNLFPAAFMPNLGGWTGAAHEF